MIKRALITGITGQDGSYLAESLLDKGYEVHGIIRRSSSPNTGKIGHLLEDSSTDSKLKLHFGDLSDSSSINKLVNEIRPEEVYNLGGQSHVGISFENPEYTVDVTGLGTLRMLEAIRNFCPETKFYQASSSEMFGKVQESTQSEETPFYPQSPYGVAKVFAHNMTKNYRESYGMFACNGILFNHESPRRGENFVTRKITQGLTRIDAGVQNTLKLGNLDSKRDWGHSREFVEAMQLMLQQDEPDDYVIATGETHSVREFIEEALKHIGMEAESNGKEGLEEEYVRKGDGKPIIKIDSRYFRPREVNLLLGDCSKARDKLGWEPQIGFNELVREMVEADRRLLDRELNGMGRSRILEV
jgi:GDPmannose 4,6-dehydratase